MKSAIIAALVGALLASSAVAETIDSAMYACTQDDDCIYVDGACPGTYAAINKKIKTQYEEKMDKMRTLIECMFSDKAKPSSPSLCKAGVCYQPD